MSGTRAIFLQFVATVCLPVSTDATVFGRCLLLNGFLPFPGLVSLPRDDFTLEFWWRSLDSPHSVAAGALDTIVSQYDLDGSLAFGFGDRGLCNESECFPLSQSAEHVFDYDVATHIAITCSTQDLTRTCMLLKDGTLLTSAQWSTAPSSIAKHLARAHLGCPEQSSAYGWRLAAPCATALVDELRLWLGVRSISEIGANARRSGLSLLTGTDPSEGGAELLWECTFDEHECGSCFVAPPTLAIPATFFEPRFEMMNGPVFARILTHHSTELDLTPSPALRRLAQPVGDIPARFIVHTDLAESLNVSWRIATSTATAPEFRRIDLKPSAAIQNNGYECLNSVQREITPEVHGVKILNFILSAALHWLGDTGPHLRVEVPSSTTRQWVTLQLQTTRDFETIGTFEITPSSPPSVGLSDVIHLSPATSYVEIESAVPYTQPITLETYIHFSQEESFVELATIHRGGKSAALAWRDGGLLWELDSGGDAPLKLFRYENAAGIPPSGLHMAVTWDPNSDRFSVFVMGAEVTGDDVTGVEATLGSTAATFYRSLATLPLESSRPDQAPSPPEPMVAADVCPCEPSTFCSMERCSLRGTAHWTSCLQRGFDCIATFVGSETDLDCPECQLDRCRLTGENCDASRPQCEYKQMLCARASARPGDEFECHCAIDQDCNTPCFSGPCERDTVRCKLAKLPANANPSLCPCELDNWCRAVDPACDTSSSDCQKFQLECRNTFKLTGSWECFCDIDRTTCSFSADLSKCSKLKRESHGCRLRQMRCLQSLATLAYPDAIQPIRRVLQSCPCSFSAELCAPIGCKKENWEKDICLQGSQECLTRLAGGTSGLSCPECSLSATCVLQGPFCDPALPTCVYKKKVCQVARRNPSYHCHCPLNEQTCETGCAEGVCVREELRCRVLKLSSRRQRARCGCVFTSTCHKDNKASPAYCDLAMEECEAERIQCIVARMTVGWPHEIWRQLECACEVEMSDCKIPASDQSCSNLRRNSLACHLRIEQCRQSLATLHKQPFSRVLPTEPKVLEAIGPVSLKETTDSSRFPVYRSSGDLGPSWRGGVLLHQSLLWARKAGSFGARRKRKLQDSASGEDIVRIVLGSNHSLEPAFHNAASKLSPLTLTEIRLWSIARDAEDIERLSKGRLRGNETSLTFYAPVTQADVQKYLSASDRESQALVSYTYSPGDEAEGARGTLYCTAPFDCNIGAAASIGYYVKSSTIGGISGYDEQRDFQSLAEEDSPRVIQNISYAIELYRDRYSFPPDFTRSIEITNLPSGSCGTLHLLRDGDVSDLTESSAPLLLLRSDDVEFRPYLKTVEPCTAELSYSVVHNISGERSSEAHLALRVLHEGPKLVAVEAIRWRGLEKSPEEAVPSDHVIALVFDGPTSRPPITKTEDLRRFMTFSNASRWGDIEALSLHGRWSNDSTTLSITIDESSEVHPMQLLAGDEVIVKGGDAWLDTTYWRIPLRHSVGSWVEPDPLITVTGVYPSLPEEPLTDSRRIGEMTLRGSTPLGQQTYWVNTRFVLLVDLFSEALLCAPDRVWFKKKAKCAACDAHKHLSVNRERCDCDAGTESLIEPPGSADFEDETCKPCPPGFEARDLRCIQCQPGFFNTEWKQAACAVCAANTYRNSSMPASAECTSCPNGTWAGLGATECLPCPEGHRRAEGMLWCERCPRGSYLLAPWDTCTECGEGRTTSQIIATLPHHCICAEGYYAPSGRPSDGCVPCPEGLECALETLKLKGGFWLPQQSTSLTFDPLELHRCLVSAIGTQVSLIASTLCPMRPIDEEVCAEHSRGFLCDDCEKGYYKRKNDLCFSCSGLRVIVYLSAAALLLFVILYRTTGGADAGFGPLLNFVFMLKALYSTSKIQWPDPFGVVLHFMEYADFSFDFVASACIDWLAPKKNFYFFQLALPIAIASAWLSLYLLSFFISALVAIGSMRRARWLWDRATFDFRQFFGCKCFGDSVRRGNAITDPVVLLLPLNLGRVLGAILHLFFLLHIPITRRAVSFLACFRHPNGRSSMTEYPSVYCYESEWIHYFLPLGVLACGTSAIGLYTFARTLYKAPREWPHNAYFRLVHSVLITSYRKDVWWWGIVVLIRGVMQTAVAVLMGNDSFMQGTALALMLGATLILHCRVWPYASLTSNVMEALLLIVLVFIVIAGLYYAPLHSDYEQLLALVPLLAILGIFLLLNVFPLVEVFNDRLSRALRLYCFRGTMHSQGIPYNDDLLPASGKVESGSAGSETNSDEDYPGLIEPTSLRLRHVLADIDHTELFVFPAALQSQDLEQCLRFARVMERYWWPRETKSGAEALLVMASASSALETVG